VLIDQMLQGCLESLNIKLSGAVNSADSIVGGTTLME
jgi:hypothetical protein